jgi:hypothetical protein
MTCFMLLCSPARSISPLEPTFVSVVLCPPPSWIPPQATHPAFLKRLALQRKGADAHRLPASHRIHWQPNLLPPSAPLLFSSLKITLPELPPPPAAPVSAKPTWSFRSRMFSHLPRKTILSPFARCRAPFARRVASTSITNSNSTLFHPCNFKSCSPHCSLRGRTRPTWCRNACARRGPPSFIHSSPFRLLAISLFPFPPSLSTTRRFDRNYFRLRPRIRQP